MTDLEIKDALLKGQEAARMLNERFRVRLEGFLLGQCGRNDEASRNRAVVIASEVIEDCFVRSPSLMERWQGGESLWPFLSRVAANRLKDYWDKRDVLKEADRPGTDGGDDERGIEDLAAAEPAAIGGREESNAARRCLAHGLSVAVSAQPEGVLFLRLKGLHGVEQRRISDVWGHDQAQTSRWIAKAMELIRSASLEFAKQNGLEVDFHDFSRHAGLLLGGTGDAAAVNSESQAALRRLSAGEEKKRRDELVREMLANPAALQFFAGLLNQSSPAQPVLVVDPMLAQAAPRLRQALVRSGETLPPEEVRGLFDEAAGRAFELHLHRAGADGGTLWLLASDRAALEAVANPLEPHIVGLRQPLKSGIISFVLGSGESVLVSSAASHQGYSPAVDQKTGQATQGMVAVPFYWCGAVRGVLSMVRFGGQPFSEADLAAAQDAAQLLSLLLESALQRKILAWE